MTARSRWASGTRCCSRARWYTRKATSSWPKMRRCWPCKTTIWIWWVKPVASCTCKFSRCTFSSTISQDAIDWRYWWCCCICTNTYENIERNRTECDFWCSKIIMNENKTKQSYEQIFVFNEVDKRENESEKEGRAQQRKSFHRLQSRHGERQC